MMTRRQRELLEIASSNPWCTKPLRLYAGVENGKRIELDDLRWEMERLADHRHPEFRREQS
jgi:hypothetical protein